MNFLLITGPLRNISAHCPMFVEEHRGLWGLIFGSASCDQKRKCRSVFSIWLLFSCLTEILLSGSTLTMKEETGIFLIIGLLTAFPAVAYLSLWESCCHLGAQNSRYNSTKQHWPHELTSFFNVFLSEQRRRLSGELCCTIKGGNEAWGFIFKITPSPSAVQTPLFACVSQECLRFFLHDTEALQNY